FSGLLIPSIPANIRIGSCKNQLTPLVKDFHGHFINESYRKKRMIRIVMPVTIWSKNIWEYIHRAVVKADRIRWVTYILIRINGHHIVTTCDCIQQIMSEGVRSQISHSINQHGDTTR